MVTLIRDKKKQVVRFLNVYAEAGNSLDPN